MKIVIDANRIIAAAMKDSTTRLILNNESFEFVTPDFTLSGKQNMQNLKRKSEGIWTHDPHFKEQKKVKVFTNIDMLRLSGKNIG